MFDHTTHDFGVVARGAKVEHRFVVENNYEEDIHIESVYVQLRLLDAASDEASAEDRGRRRRSW